MSKVMHSAELVPTFKLSITECHDLTSLAAYLLAGHVKQCFYECGCSHGRCSTPSDHNYFDVDQFKTINYRLCEVGAGVTSKSLRRDTKLSDITVYIHDTVTPATISKILKLNVEHRVYCKIPDSGHKTLRALDTPMVILEGDLYSLSPVR
jgi:hypothetical protein